MDVSYRAGFTDATRPEPGADRVATLLYRHEVPLPEDVKAAFEVASPFARVSAFLIDLGVVALLNIIVIVLGLMALVGTAMAGSWGLGFALIMIAFFAVNVGYFFLFETFLSGQTPGKMAMKLRVIKEDGEEIAPAQGLVRSFIRFAIIGPLPALLIGGLFSVELLMAVAPLNALAIVMFIDRKSRGLPDLVAGTLVIVQKLPTHNMQRPYVPPYFHLPYHHFPLNHTEMSKLTPLDYARLEEFGTRLSTISSSARQQAAMAAAAALAKRMNYGKPVEPEYAELFLFEMHSALKQQLMQLYPDLYA
ncbi:MAG: RDD family protein [Planctomycetes bacterium]|nr:RDD family protein [Planctomycetota bacterium]MCW8135866.1 RDD family protein [Planctomycetota bacterium]